MITRRGFFGTVAALVVGARARLQPVPAAEPLGLAALVRSLPPAAIKGISHASFPFWRAHVPASTGALTAEHFRAMFDACERDFTRVPRRDDGDSILELR